MRPHIVFQSTKVMSCVFYAIVIKNQALREKYPGGLKSFLEDEPTTRCNRHLTLDCYFDRIDTFKTEDILKNKGFISGVDYIIFEADNCASAFGIRPGNRDRFLQVDLGTPWLKGKYTSWGIDVWYVNPHTSPLLESAMGER